MDIVDATLRRLSRSGLRRAVGGGHWSWWLIGLAAFVLRRARRRDELVTTIDLAPGDRYLVSLHGPKDPISGTAAG